MASEPVPTHVRAVLIALFVTFLWSSSWVLIRWGLDQEALEPINPCCPPIRTSSIGVDRLGSVA